MSNEDQWRSFGDVVAMLETQIGSDLIAWDDIENHLTSGRIRAKASFSRIHELTGAVIRTEERILKADWWQRPGRFGRLHGKIVLWREIEEYQVNGWAASERAFRNPTWYCTNIMLWMPNIIALYPDVVGPPKSMNASELPPSSPQSPVARRRGPKPSVSERVKTEMRKMALADLRSMKELTMETMFRASRDTCRKARDEILSEFDN